MSARTEKTLIALSPAVNKLNLSLIRFGLGRLACSLDWLWKPVHRFQLLFLLPLCDRCPVLWLGTERSDIVWLGGIYVRRWQFQDIPAAIKWISFTHLLFLGMYMQVYQGTRASIDVVVDSESLFCRGRDDPKAFKLQGAGRVTFAKSSRSLAPLSLWIYHDTKNSIWLCERCRKFFLAIPSSGIQRTGTDASMAYARSAAPKKKNPEVFFIDVLAFH